MIKLILLFSLPQISLLLKQSALAFLNISNEWEILLNEWIHLRRNQKSIYLYLNNFILDNDEDDDDQKVALYFLQ